MYLLNYSKLEFSILPVIFPLLADKRRQQPLPESKSLDWKFSLFYIVAI